MYKAIGWDIGIKNLAYCVLESNPDNVLNTGNTKENLFTFNKHNYNISHWKDISLVTHIESNLATAGQVSHINNTLTCCGIKSPSKKKPTSTSTTITNNDELQHICGKKASYAKEELTEAGEYEGLCKTHFKKLKIARLPILSVKKCWTEGCCSKPVQVLKSHIFKGYCKKHINEMQNAKTHTDSDFFKINHAKTTAKIDINQLGIALFQELNKIKECITEPNVILLENQPVLKNPTMKSMQMFLYSYYLMNILDSNIDLSIKKLQCYCASKKLDMIKCLTEEEQTTINTFIDTVKNPYQKNKKMSIMIVEVLLKNNAKWLEYFKSHPKQDDLADSLLMTLHYFEKQDLGNPARKKQLLEKAVPKHSGKQLLEKAVPKHTGKQLLEKAVPKPTKKKSAKAEIIPIVDAEGSAMIDDKKSKRKNRLITNAKYKKNEDII